MSLGAFIPVLSKPDPLFEGVTPLYSSEKKIPGSWQYSIKRYPQTGQNDYDNYGVLVYNFDNQLDKNYLGLKFCVTGQTYCKQSDVNCEDCKLNKNALCVEQSGTVDFLEFRFEPNHLTNLITSEPGGETEEILNFRYKHTFSKPIVLNGRIRHTLDSILNHRYHDTVQNIFINAQTQILLLYTLEAVSSIKEDEVPACKFLVHLEDREKIIKAREILLSHIGDPITIKELSRKAAINECYLKKGFKVMFGTTIFDFYQDQRMEHARYLLYEKGLSVSEVSASLGYSSISHFSTAFKKHTGLKPCDLLSPIRHK